MVLQISSAFLRSSMQISAPFRAPTEVPATPLLKIQQANADGIRYLKEAGADEAVLRLKSLEAFIAAADL